MPQDHDFLNKKEECDTIKLDNILVKSGRLHVTLRWVAARLFVAQSILQSAINDLSNECDFYQSGGNVWLDSAAFYDVSTHPTVKNLIQESSRAAILQLLGEFPRKLGRAQ